MVARGDSTAVRVEWPVKKDGRSGPFAKELLERLIETVQSWWRFIRTESQ
jgi:hypothetical protein